MSLNIFPVQRCEAYHLHDLSWLVIRCFRPSVTPQVCGLHNVL
jgi:hypothetical protein